MPAAAVRSPSSIGLLDRRRGRRALATEGSDGGRGLAERLVDRVDDLLTGLVGPHRLDHVHHGLVGIGAGAFEGAGANLTGDLAGDRAGRAGDVVVADLL